MSVHGPVRGVVGRRPICVTTGNRVRAVWQDYGHLLGTATVRGFELDDDTGEVIVLVETDRPDPLTASRMNTWPADRAVLCTGHYDGETQQQSVARHLAWITDGERQVHAEPLPAP